MRNETATVEKDANKFLTLDNISAGIEFRIGLQWFLGICKTKIKLPTKCFEYIFAHSFICVRANLHHSRRLCSSRWTKKKEIFEASLIFNFIGNYKFPYLDTHLWTSFMFFILRALAERHKTHSFFFLNIEPKCYHKIYEQMWIFRCCSNNILLLAFENYGHLYIFLSNAFVRLNSLLLFLCIRCLKWQDYSNCFIHCCWYS